MNIQSSSSLCIIGGYDLLSKSFFSEVKSKHYNSIFINVNEKQINKKSIYNYEIFELKKIINTLKKHKVRDILFIGKINRPNLSEFKNDGEIEKHLPSLIKAYRKGDGFVLATVIKIFEKKGYNILSPLEISNKFFLAKKDLSRLSGKADKYDINKSVKILNDLSRYDNAQAMVIVNGYILAIEAAEGTDDLLKRTAIVRKKLKQLELSAGFLVKIPKKNQSKLIDLPVIGLKTLNLVKKANLSGIAINAKFTIIKNKIKFMKLAREYSINIYNINS